MPEMGRRTNQAEAFSARPLDMVESCTAAVHA